MSVQVDFLEERAEVEAVLRSEAFARSPAMVQMFRYVCERYFEGAGNAIKEYSIAVEALGRSADFDQGRDSIVRVEAYRLRRRLERYYQRDGLQHEIRISIPLGTYVPQFARRARCADGQTDDATTPDVLDSGIRSQTGAKLVGNPIPAATPLKKEERLRIWLHLFLFLLAAALAGFGLTWHSSTRVAPKARANPALAPLLIGTDEVRILAGSDGNRLLDQYGNTWIGDRYFEGGAAQSISPRPIMYAQDSSMYWHRRRGAFSYHIPLKPGSYELRLYFAETYFGEDNPGGGGEASRFFSVRANSRELLKYLDVISDAGGSNTADIKVFKDIEPAADGFLHLSFTPLRDVAFLNALEIVRSRPGAIRPIRVLARNSNYRDDEDRAWSADRYFRGGVLNHRQVQISGASDSVLYQGERFGNFSYAIPVAVESRYDVTLHFCEGYFVHPLPGQSLVGARSFDVYLNGRKLLNDLDIFKTAGSLRALDRTFTDLQPNAQGKLQISFVPTRNYATVSAIEVIDENWR